ncbi:MULTISPECIES: hypothetical protein [Streptomyces]|uniref:Integral membrane protein n=1 Tax=Streptomyces solicathayae TaxID=3081768 RepID=A0ABZ0LWC3_9ACTN|nr:hypothetical protein [Streptomyces sp. HUAS YS2]WOX23625.1 hypothetical protein R2D22_20455 [Streptomyces sp. HUAS YS2]
MGALLIVAGLALAVASAAMFGRLLPHQIERYEAYQAAEPCPREAPAVDCLQELTFTVTSVRMEPQRRGSYAATLYLAPSLHTHVDFGNPDPLLQRLKPGDRVVGTVWRRQVTELDRGGVRQATTDRPRDDYQGTAGAGTGLGLLAALGLVFGMARVARPDSYESLTVRSSGRPLFIVTMVVGVVGGLPALWLDLPWWTVPPVSTLIVAYVAWYLWRPTRTAGTDTAA